MPVGNCYICSHTGRLKMKYRVLLQREVLQKIQAINYCVCFKHLKDIAFSNPFVHSLVLLWTDDIFTESKE